MERISIEERRLIRGNQEGLKELMNFQSTLEINVELNKKACNGKPYIPEKNKGMDEDI